MNHVVAKVKGRDNVFEKLYSGENIFELPDGLDSAVEYNPETILEDDEWYKLEAFSSTSYIIDELTHDFNTTDYDEANRVKNENIY